MALRSIDREEPTYQDEPDYMSDNWSVRELPSWGLPRKLFRGKPILIIEQNQNSIENEDQTSPYDD